MKKLYVGLLLVVMTGSVYATTLSDKPREVISGKSPRFNPINPATGIPYTHKELMALEISTLTTGQAIWV